MTTGDTLIVADPSFDDRSLMAFLQRPSRFLFFTGKGGVGMTSMACAAAIALADRGLRVLLVSTDPASNLDTGNSCLGPLAGLQKQREVFEQVMNTTGNDLDASGRALLEEDLRSPCTEEIAVFRAFARTVAQGEDAFVVLDTAPTGHTLLLLDATVGRRGTGRTGEPAAALSTPHTALIQSTRLLE